MTRHDALQRAFREIARLGEDGPPDHVLYMSHDREKPGAVMLLFEEIFPVPFALPPCWVAFVDLNPTANWRHQALLLFFAEEETHRMEVESPPTNLAESYSIEAWRVPAQFSVGLT